MLGRACGHIKEQTIDHISVIDPSSVHACSNSMSKVRLWYEENQVRKTIRKIENQIEKYQTHIISNFLTVNLSS